MSIAEQGRQGEALARTILKNEGFDVVLQADWVVTRNGKWYLVEVKHKEMFDPPPFLGQGLPLYQVKARMRFYAATGIRCMLFVIDKNTGEPCWQWLDVLEGTEYLDTRKGIRIYNIEHFRKI